MFSLWNKWISGTEHLVATANWMDIPYFAPLFFLHAALILVIIIFMFVGDWHWGRFYLNDQRQHSYFWNIFVMYRRNSAKVIRFIKSLTNPHTAKVENLFYNSYPYFFEDKEKNWQNDFHKSDYRNTTIINFFKTQLFLEEEGSWLKNLEKKLKFQFSKNFSNQVITTFRYEYREFSKEVGNWCFSYKKDLGVTFEYLFFIYLKGWSYVFSGIKTWWLSVFISGHILYFLIVLQNISTLKVVFAWTVVSMIAYWLLSGFVSFSKKYQFSKYTSAIQRFWRRSYILFWLIEFSLFLVFIYLTLNANNESWYMFDQLQVSKTGLYSWRSFVVKIFPLTLLLILGYLLLLSLKWNIFTKHTPFLLILTILLIYVVWSEFYQFFHVVNFYGNFNWFYDADERVWSLELENRKSRTINHYIMLMIMLKFWHIIIIFLIWVFFLLRSIEIGRIRYPLFSANLQNFLILYLFAWVFMFPWFKFICRKYLEFVYFWFYVNNRELGVRVFYSEISCYWYSLLNCDWLQFCSNGLNFLEYDFFYFSDEDEFFSFRKSNVKDLILSKLTYI